MKKIRGAMITWLFLAMFVLFLPQSAEAAFQAKGIDVSRWQGAINWQEVKNDGIEFVMVGMGRFRNGVGIPDPMFDQNMQGAIAQDIKVGVYLYSEAATVAEAEAEAEFVLDQIDGYKISYPVAFDIEDTVHTGLTTAQRTDLTIAFLSVIEEAGYYPMIYASQNWLQERMDLARLYRYDKWVARWAPQVEFQPLSMWQYSSTGKVKGIGGPVDLDYSFVDYTQFIVPRYKAEKRRQKYGWQTDGIRKWYVQEDGTTAKNTFLTVGTKTYYMDADGYISHGWKKVGGKYYYLTKKSGYLKKGWLTIKGKQYYLTKKSGARKTGWLTLGSNKYYLNKKGILQKGWVRFGKKAYFMRTVTGKMYKGMMRLNGNFYYFSKKTGLMRRGWLTLKGEKYYFDQKGVRAAGWTQIKGKWYYFNTYNGMMQKNTWADGYLLGPDGVCTNRK